MNLYNNQDKALSIWLGIVCFAIIVMVFIGGLTRLTGSGLSMTKWHPVTGIFPPMSEVDWHAEFQSYKQSPEYKKINYNMGLQEFKSIFWLEFIHRTAGRITGLILAVPLIFFIFKGNIRGWDILYYLGIAMLFSVQGFMGWYMVKSGLVDNPHVSHFRLAAHLMLAMFIYILVFWQKMRHSFDIMLIYKDDHISGYRWAFYAAIITVLAQMFLGALVAGLNAGLVYNTYPMMGDNFIPSELKAADGRFIFTSLSDPVLVQFLHRVMALIVFVAVVFVYMKCISSEIKALKKAAYFILFAVIIQISLGIATLVYMVPISYALAHQIGAIFLISSLFWGLFLVKNT